MKKSQGNSIRRPSSLPQRKRILRLEPLERRHMLVTVTVDSAADLPEAPGAAALGMPGWDGEIIGGVPQYTLRAAIQAVNADLSGVLNNIRVFVPQVFIAGSALPVITKPVFITGNFGGQTVIDGTAAGAAADGLTLASNGCILEYLVIEGFSADGLKILSSNNYGFNVGIAANGGDGINIAINANNNDFSQLNVGFGFGVAPVAMALDGNQGAGIVVNSSWNTLSGTIGQNRGNGVEIVGSSASYNDIAGIIGYNLQNAATVSGQGNGGDGVEISQGANNNFIRTDILNSAGAGVKITGDGSNYNRITAFIGLYSLGGGSYVVGGNAGAGVEISDGASYNFVNSCTISSNSGDGIDIEGVSDSGQSSEYNRLSYNYIGGDLGGVLYPNLGDGIKISEGASFNIIGFDSSDLFGGNWIESGYGTGILVEGTADDGTFSQTYNTTNNVIAGNSVGINYTGLPFSGASAGNKGGGIEISSGAQFNLIGSNGDGIDDTREWNIIVDNGNVLGKLKPGIEIADQLTENNVVSGNWIGNYLGALTDDSGAAYGNGGAGIEISNGASQNLIGSFGDNSDNAGEANVIGGNGGAGVTLEGTDGDSDTPIVTSYNTVAGNQIGVYGDTSSSPTVWSPIPNAGAGIELSKGTTYNLIGGNGGSPLYGRSDVTNSDLGHGLNSGHDAAEQNIIGANDDSNVSISGLRTDWNQIAGNMIGVAPDGTAFPSLTEDAANVEISGGASHNTIGTTGSDGHIPSTGDDVFAGNVVGGSTGVGISIKDFNTQYNSVAGNLIGLANVLQPNGSILAVAVPNLAGGIEIENAQRNTIGFDGLGAYPSYKANIISGNGTAATDETPAVGFGVSLTGAFAALNAVSGNRIGTDPSGLLAIPNQGPGVQLEKGAFNNFVGTDDTGFSDDKKGNWIAGNADVGVLINGTQADGSDIATDDPNTTGNLVAGNLIGLVLQLNGVGKALPNTSGGVEIENGAQSNVIGVHSGDADMAYEGNVISGNWVMGVELSGANTSANTIDGNVIGSDAAKTLSIPNQGAGLLVTDGVHNNIFGVADTDWLFEANFIAFNSGNGIQSAASNSNLFAGNTIKSNGANGVLLFDGSSANIIGTDGNDGSLDAHEGNLISANGIFGVSISGALANSNRLAGNTISGNANNGVLVANGAEGNIIGTNNDGFDDAIEGNLIQANGGNGVTIDGSNTDYNLVSGDTLRSNGTAAVYISNGAEGNVIGGTNFSIQGNHISSETDGVFVNGAEGNAIIGNDIAATDLPILLENIASEGTDQLAPTLSGVSYDATTRELTINFSVSDSLSALFPLRIDFYLTNQTDTSGQAYLGTASYTATDASTGDGTVTISLLIPTSVDVNSSTAYVVATATDSGSSSAFAMTSMFSVPVSILMGL